MCSNFGSRSSSLRLQIRLVEELRVRQPRADHALAAGDDRLAAVARLDVGDHDELVGELAGLGIAQHEAFLVVADGGADHLRRDFAGTPRRTSPSAPPAIRPGRRPRRAGPRPRPARSLARTRGSWRRPGSSPRGAPDRARPWRRRASPRSRRSRLTLIAAGAMKRWPRVVSPTATPSTLNGTMSGSSVSGPKVATMECSGRTQLSEPDAPAHRLRPGKRLHHLGHDLGDHLDRRPARPSRSPRRRSRPSCRAAPWLR